MTRAWLASALVLVTGCAPVLVWHGRSPDRARRAVVVEEGGRQRLALDDAPPVSWDAIGITHLTWSGSRIVYPARRGDRWHLAVGAEAGPPFEAIGDVVVAGARVAYAALDADGWHVVLDGQVGPAFASLAAGSLAFGPRGRRLVYVARDARGQRVVIDGVAGAPFVEVRAVAFGAKGTRLGYVGVEADGARVVIEDRVGPRVDEVLALALASAEPRWAAIVREGDAHTIVHDGRAIGSARQASGLAIASDGARVAWVEAEDELDRVVRDGERLRAHRAIEALQFVPGTGALVYVAHDGDGARVVHDGEVGPRLDRVEALVTSEAGHVGYVGARRVGRVVVIDGVARFRGEWAGALTLAARGDGWAFLAREAGRRFVVTPDGRVEVESPFADTLVLDDGGARWALAVADRASRTVRVLVDGRVVARLDPDELAAAISQGRDPTAAARAIVAAELARAR